MPTVSVVIPSARGGAFLREAVASVRAQTFSDWELVIVMDGCNEDVSDVERSEGRLRVLRQRNRGVAIARNVGIEDADSPLIAFLDDDDRMLPGRLAAQVGQMGEEEVGLCHTQFRYIDEYGEILGSGISKESQYIDFLRNEGEILLSTTKMRKSIIEDVGGFNPVLPLCEDLDLIYRIARVSRLRFLPEALTEYRRHGSNTSPTTSGEDELKLILKEHLRAAEAHGEKEHIRAVQYRLSYIMTGGTQSAIRRAHESRVRGDRLGMIRALGVAFVLSPMLTLRVSIRQTRRDKLARRALRTAARSRTEEREETST